jgi:signal transduction histidine kinase
MPYMSEPDQSLQQILRQLNHDLRSPLSTISMGIEAIRALKHDPEQIDAICDMMADQGVEAIKKILDEL